LAVARNIMDLHQGSIGIENRPEGGARVTLTFKP
jgi:signal transduction histidine kinase